MSTPNTQVQAVPGEIVLSSPGPAAAATGVSPPGVSPGVAGSAVRAPTAPTLPDADPASLHLAVARMANELFGAGGWFAPVDVQTAANPAAAATPASPGVGGVPADVPDGGRAPEPSGSQGQPSPTKAAPTAVAADSPHIPVDSQLGQPQVAQPSGDAAAAINPFTAPLDWSTPLAPVASHDSALPSAFAWPLLEPAASPQVTAPVEDAATDSAKPKVGHQDRAPVPAAESDPRSGVQPAVAPVDFEVRPLVDTGIRPAPVGFDAHAIKAEFPILHQQVHGRPLVWLDNAATTQKPRAVIDRLKRFYEHENSNIHRAAHTLAARATDAYEEARESVRRFVNAGSVRDVVFVRGTTEGINLVAQTWGRRHIEAGDEIILTQLEHHANIVPWQLLAAEKGARLRVAPVDDDGQIILEDYEKLFNSKTKFVSLPQVSNALGTVTPAEAMIAIAHRHGVKVLLDGAQSVSHMRTDLQQLKPDFFVFSGHKVFAPTGIGAVVAPAELWDSLPPWQGGGNMIADVTFERTQFQAAPARFEAGTGNIADAVGLGAALDWVQRVGIENIGRHEHELLQYGTQKLQTVAGLRIIGTAAEKAGVLSFVVAGFDTHTISSALDKEGIAVRGGHHCAQPILRRFGLESTVRASLAPYNTFEDLDALAAALCRITGQRGVV